MEYLLLSSSAYMFKHQITTRKTVTGDITRCPARLLCWSTKKTCQIVRELKNENSATATTYLHTFHVIATSAHNLCKWAKNASINESLPNERSNCHSGIKHSFDKIKID